MSQVTLKDISTRELMRALKGLHVLNEGDPEDPLKFAGRFERRQRIANRLVKGGDSEACMATESELIAELNTRPHIPGRAEGKVLRRLMAQTGWTADQLRAHPKFGEELADAQYPNRRHIPQSWAANYQKVYGESFGRLYKVIA